MKTGIQLIAKERKEQLTKHGRSVEDDVKYNHGKYKIRGEKVNNPQLIHAASQLIHQDDDIFRKLAKTPIFTPKNWNKKLWHRMMDKPYKERLIIAGALIAAELDRIQYEEK